MDFFYENIVVFQTIAPLFVSLILVLMRKRQKTVIYLTICSSVILFFNAVLIFMATQKFSILSYNFGNWSSQIGIEHRMDNLSSIVLLLLSFIFATLSFWLVNLLRSKSQYSQTQVALYCSCLMLLMSGQFGMVITGDIFNFYVFLEISALATYALASATKNKHASYSSFNYVIIGTVSASLILLAIGIIYMTTGHLNMFEIKQIVKLFSEQSAGKISPNHVLLILAMILMVFGFLLKIAFFPFHSWLVGVYVASPIFSVAIFSGTISKVMIYGLIRFLFDILDFRNVASYVPIQEFFLIICVFSVVIPALKALKQVDLKAVLAFSSISQVGLIIAALMLEDEISLAASLLLMINHAIVKTSLFTGVFAIERRIGMVNLDNMHHIARYMPKTSMLIVFNCLSLIGIPLTFGFSAKWYFITALISKALYGGASVAGILMLILLIISTIFTLFYVIKIIESIYFKNNKEKIEVKKEASNLSLFIMSVFALVNLSLMYGSEFVIQIVQNVVFLR